MIAQDTPAVEDSAAGARNTFHLGEFCGLVLFICIALGWLMIPVCYIWMIEGPLSQWLNIVTGALPPAGMLICAAGISRHP